MAIVQVLFTGSFTDLLHHDAMCLISHRETAVRLLGRYSQEPAPPRQRCDRVWDCQWFPQWVRTQHPRISSTSPPEIHFHGLSSRRAPPGSLDLDDVN